MPKFKVNDDVRNGMLTYWKDYLKSSEGMSYYYGRALDGHRTAQIAQGLQVPLGLNYQRLVINVLGLTDLETKPYDTTRQFRNIWNTEILPTREAAINALTAASITDVLPEEVVDYANALVKDYPNAGEDTILNRAMEIAYKEKRMNFRKDMNKKSAKQSIITTYTLMERINETENIIQTKPITAAYTQAQKDADLETINLYNGDRLIKVFGDLMPYSMRRTIELMGQLNGTNDENITNIFKDIEIEKRMLNNDNRKTNDEYLSHEMQSVLEAATIQFLAKADPAFNQQWGFQATCQKLGEDVFKRNAPEKYQTQMLLDMSSNEDPYQIYLDYKIFQMIHGGVI